MIDYDGHAYGDLPDEDEVCYNCGTRYHPGVCSIDENGKHYCPYCGREEG